MTEKRFVSEDGCCGYYTEIIDNEKELDLSLHNPKKNLTLEELVDLLNAFYNENEQLKQSYAQLKHRHSLLHDECLDAECERDSLKKDVLSLEKENKQLKSEIKDLNDLLARYEEKELKE